MNPDLQYTGEERQLITTCALRFDGYEYVQNRKFDHLAAFRTIEQTGDLAPFEQHQLLALFFMLQRYLHKGGGEMLSERSPEWRIYRELFFRCCRASIPKAYRVEPYYTEWERNYAPRLEECIALVRRIHESIDYLPKSMPHPSLK